eukprot:2825751-Prymnesium_polylepis.2
MCDQRACRASCQSPDILTSHFVCGSVLLLLLGRITLHPHASAFSFTDYRMIRHGTVSVSDREAVRRDS